jgi:hypothetical protein
MSAIDKYTHTITVPRFREMLDRLKEFLKPFEPRMQYASVEDKVAAYGRRLNVYILGFPPGLVGDERGLPEHEWNEFIASFKQLIEEYLPGVHYIKDQPWTEGQKSWVTVHTFVMFEELAPLLP